MTSTAVKWLRVAIAVVLGTLFVYYVFPKLIIWFLPFILAYLVMSIANPVIVFAHDRLRINRKFASVVIVTLIFIILGGVVAFVVTKLVQELMTFVGMLTTQEQIPTIFQNWYDNLKGYYKSLPTEWVASIDTALIQISEQFVNIAKGIAKWTTDFASSIPKAMFFTIVTIVATFLMTIDKDKVSKTIGKLVPKRFLKLGIIVKEDVFKALGGFIKAGLLMYIIVTSTVVLGLTLLGIKYALLIGVIIGLLDMLPAVGTGAFLIPWGIYSIITGNIYIGIGLGVLFFAVVLIRESSAPKIIGSRIGLHPLVTLMSSYVGLEILGGAGLVIGPVIVIVVSKMYNAGVFGELYKLIIGDTTIED